MDVLTFEMKGDPYGVELDDVDEVLHMATCRPLPGAPPFVSGVLNLRGDLLPVVDLTARLGLAERRPDTEDALSAYPTDSRLLIAAIGAYRVAMIIDGWRGVISLTDEQLRSAVVREDAMPPYVNGIGIVEATGSSQTMQLIKVKGVLDANELQQLTVDANAEQKRPETVKKTTAKPTAKPKAKPKSKPRQKAKRK